MGKTYIKYTCSKPNILQKAHNSDNNGVTMLNLKYPTFYRMNITTTEQIGAESNKNRQAVCTQFIYPVNTFVWRGQMDRRMDEIELSIPISPFNFC